MKKVLLSLFFVFGFVGMHQGTIHAAAMPEKEFEQFKQDMAQVAHQARLKRAAGLMAAALKEMAHYNVTQAALRTWFNTNRQKMEDMELIQIGETVPLYRAWELYLIMNK
jgi:hypothetical protein